MGDERTADRGDFFFFSLLSSSFSLFFSLLLCSRRLLEYDERLRKSEHITLVRCEGRRVRLTRAERAAHIYLHCIQWRGFDLNGFGLGGGRETVFVPENYVHIIRKGEI